MARTFTLNGRITRRSLKRAYSINLLTCVRVGVSLRHAYVSHHPQHENASERDKYLEKRSVEGRNIACRLSARVTRRRKVASTSHRDRRRTAVYLLCVCVCLTVCDHAVWRRASNVARARTREHGAAGADRIGAMRARRRGGYRRWRRLRRARRRRDVA